VCARFLIAIGLTLTLCAFAPTLRAAEENHDKAATAGQEAPGAHDGHGGAHDHIGLGNPGKSVESPEEFKSDLSVATFVVFLVLLAILWRFAWGPIVAALERREEMVANHIREAERNHEEAKLLLAEYERKLAGAANEVRELMEEARRDAEHTKQEILAEAKTAAEAEKARALRDIDLAADAAVESLRERSVELAVELAGKIVQAQLTKADHARLISEAMTKFPAGTASSN
jgi:F-type H+-transporting ATPase subunit b